MFGNYFGEILKSPRRRVDFVMKENEQLSKIILILKPQVAVKG